MNAWLSLADRFALSWWQYAAPAALQAGAVGGVLLAVVALDRRWPAQLRYAFLIVALVKFAVPPFAAAPTGVFSRFESAGELEELRTMAGSSAESPLDSHGDGTGKGSPRSESSSWRGDARETVTRSDQAPALVLRPSSSTDRTPNSSDIRSDGRSTYAASTVVSWHTYLFLGYVAGLLAMAGRIFVQAIRLETTVRRSVPAATHELDSWASSHSSWRHPRVLLSTELAVPCSAGLLRPVILLPLELATQLTPAELRVVVGHEAAHHRRGDLWGNALQTVLLAVWWFHPVMWWLSAALRRVREDCCDDSVLSQRLASDQDYCATLLRVANVGRRRLSFSNVALSMSGGGHPLGERFRRIMDQTVPRRPHLGMRSWLLCTIVAVLLWPGLHANSVPADTESQFPATSASDISTEPNAVVDSSSELPRAATTSFVDAEPEPANEGDAPPRADVAADHIYRAIAQGVDYLKKQQHEDGSWQEHPTLRGGVTALCTLALLNCGVSNDDPQMQAALDYLRNIPPKWNYVVCLQTMVFCAAELRADRPSIERNVQWLEEKQKRADKFKGAWGYPEGNGDNSNTQFAVLALYEAQRVGVPTSMQTWRRIQQYWKGSQHADGSWGYKPNDAGSGSMTSAGIGAMAMISEMLDEGDAVVLGEHVQCCRPHDANDEIEKGLVWLGANFSVRANPGDDPRGFVLYYIYGLERAGRLTNQRMIGGHDWYREGATWLVKQQDGQLGSWKGNGLGETDPQVGTSLALLFLSKGRRPVVAAKLKHGPENDWNHHRNDLANLVSYAEKRWRRDLTWQVMDIDGATTEELMEAPVLYFNGEAAPELSGADIRKLREYVDRGGFILADAVCEGKEFDRTFRDVVQRIFPEPDRKLHALPAEHAIWNAEERVDLKSRPALWGLDIEGRTAVVYCPENLSCYWELARVDRKSNTDKQYPAEIQGRVDAARGIGVNFLTYATGREPKYKLHRTPLGQEP